MTLGVLGSPEMGVYAGWVAHENSFGAGQLFFNERRDVALSFQASASRSRNAHRLREKGHELGQAAGNWLVHLYEEEGDQFFETLNGLFSGLLIDKRQGKAFLFNDRYGVERIYWHETRGCVFSPARPKGCCELYRT